MANSAVMDMVSVADGIEWQARHAEEAGATCTARVIRAVAALGKTDTATGRRIANWQGLLLADAMPLRITGALHNLVLTGEDDRLTKVYSGVMTDQTAIDALVCELGETYDTRLLPWLDGPPQTNEAGRSASLMAGLLWLANRLGPKFRLFEIGSSAGINTMMERYRFDLGGVTTGPESSPMLIRPDWRGPPPPEAEVEITGIEGCDQSPIDLSDPEAALRLKSYVWPEALGRMQRIEAAIELASQKAPKVVKEDAADFVERVLAQPAEPGATRVLFHSIVWQYLPDEGQQRIRDAMHRTGAETTEDAPLAWVQLETNRKTFRHELKVRYWPGGEESALLGCAHPHGEWVEWNS